MDWTRTAPVDWIQKSTTAKDVRELTQFLEQQGTFLFPTLPNGLFSAAAGEGGDYELSGYHNVWVRDNMQIAWAHLAVLNDAAIPRACVQSLTAFFTKYRHRFTDIIGNHKRGNHKRGHFTYLIPLVFRVAEERTQGRAVWRLLPASEDRRMGCPEQDCGGAI